MNECRTAPATPGLLKSVEIYDTSYFKPSLEFVQLRNLDKQKLDIYN